MCPVEVYWVEASWVPVYHGYWRVRRTSAPCRSIRSFPCGHPHTTLVCNIPTPTVRAKTSPNMQYLQGSDPAYLSAHTSAHLFERQISEMFDGDWPRGSITATSSDDRVTVRVGSCASTAAGGAGTHRRCVTYAPATLGAQATPRVICRTPSGSSFCHQEATSGTPTYETLPTERHAATITVRWTGAGNGRSATSSFTVTIVVDPNED